MLPKLDGSDSTFRVTLKRQNLGVVHEREEAETGRMSHGLVLEESLITD